MRKERLPARAIAVFLCAALAFSQPLGAVAQVVRAPSLVPASVAASAGAAALSSPTAPLTAAPLTAAPALAPSAAALTSLQAAPPAPAPALVAASIPAAPSAALPASALAASPLSASALAASPLAGPERPVESSRDEAGRAFDLTAARPASQSDAVSGAESAGSAVLFPAAPRTPALKTLAPVPGAAPRWRARARAYAPKVVLAAAAGFAAWALHSLGVHPGFAAAPLALLAGTLGGRNGAPGGTDGAPSPSRQTEFMALAAKAAPAGSVLTHDEVSRIAAKLALDGEQAQAVISALMERGELGMRDNQVIVRYDFAARAHEAAEPRMTEQQGDLAALEAVKLLNSGAPMDHAKGLASAANALSLYDRSEHETGVRLDQRKEAEILRANLALEHLGDLLRLHKAGVEARRPEGDAFRQSRVADVDEALDWLKTATYAKGQIPVLKRELHAKMLIILAEVTPRDEHGGQPEELVTAYIETVDLLEKFDPFYFLDPARPAAPPTKAEDLARAFRDGILESTKPGTPVRAELIASVSAANGLSEDQAAERLTGMAREGWLLLRDNGVMIRSSIAGRLEAAAPGDALRSPHEKALSAIKLSNSTDVLDHLRALARFDEADSIYRGVYRARAQPDGLHQELQVLRANAALEVAADALRALRARGLDEAERLPAIEKGLAWIKSAYYSSDRRLEMPPEIAESLDELLDLRAFREVVKGKINGDLEIVRGTRLAREFLRANAHGDRTVSARTVEEDVAPTAGGFRPLKTSDYPSLFTYGTDLTKKGSEGTMRPMIGRKAELRQMLKTLLRVEKNNPLVIGEKGVGKTAIVNGLAQLIANGDIPELRGKNVIKIDLTKVVAGTRYRGQFEERMQAIVDEAKKSEGRVILFIDEIHMIVGLGDSDKATDAAQILKESLADGSISVIGATTMDEFRKIEKDGALMRRFNPVKLLPPTKDEAEAIVEGVKSIYEKKHGVSIALETVKAAVALAARYVTDRHLPDSALDLMDDASAEVQLKASEAIQAGQENPTKAVTAEDIAQEISMRTGIPAGKLNEDKKTALKNLPNELKGQVIGQDEAVEAVAEAVQAGETGYRDPKQPIASFVFLGPTGVGKTELARALAKVKFGSEKNMLRLDMSEYQEKHSVSRLISAPPGYSGHDDGGQLTESIRRNPYQVILLDEIEKAHPDVFDVLLQVLEDGRLTDGQGRTVDFSNTIIIMTSNIGGSVEDEDGSGKKREPIGFRLGGAEEKKDDGFTYKLDGFGFNAKLIRVPKHEGSERRAKYLDAFKAKYRPEFVNRVGEDRVLVFNELKEKAKLGLILDLRLKALESQLKDKGLKVTLTGAAREAVLAKALTQSRYGARPIKQIVDREINRALKDADLDGRITDGDAVLVDWDAAAGRYRADKAR